MDANQLYLNTMFPFGATIGVINPYLKLSYSGTLSLRNDRKENIIVKIGGSTRHISNDNLNG